MIISMMCIIFPLLVLGCTWLILSCINRTNVSQLDVNSHGNAVHEEYETVPSHVFFLKQKGWRLLKRLYIYIYLYCKILCCPLDRYCCTNEDLSRLKASMEINQ